VGFVPFFKQPYGGVAGIFIDDVEMGVLISDVFESTVSGRFRVRFLFFFLRSFSFLFPIIFSK
jgi:hypothetical protein